MKIKNTISSYIPNSLRFGKEYKKTLNFLLQSDTFSKEEKEKWQLEKLNEILMYSNEYIPYYKRIFKEINLVLPLKELKEVEKIPYLTKNIIRENFEELKSTKKIKGFIVNTGGSTGTPLKLFKSKANNIKEQAFLDFYMQKIGLNSFKTRKAILRGPIPSNGKIFERNGNELILSSYLLTEETISEYIKVLEKFNPQILHVYPSSVYILAKLIEKNNLKIHIPNLKVIFSSSETFNTKQKEFISKIFNCKIFDLYGNTENSVQATNLYPEKSYKFNEFYSYVEIKDSEIISTGFNDFGMPLIRYKTGDEIEHTNEGNIFIKGRTQDYILGKKKEKYPIVGIIFGQHFSAFKDMGNFQITQKELGKIVFIIEGNKLSSEKENEIKITLEEATNNNLEVTIKYIDKIKRTNRGKYKFLEQNIKEVKN